jgi:hypothetical protein
MVWKEEIVTKCFILYDISQERLRKTTEKHCLFVASSRAIYIYTYVSPSNTTLFLLN